MPPRNGVRFTLRLRSDDADVVYGFAAEARDQRHEGRVRVTRDGNVRFEQCESLPEPVRSSMRALLRALWRPRSTSGLPWPRRLQRWRDLDTAEGA